MFSNDPHDQTNNQRSPVFASLAGVLAIIIIVAGSASLFLYIVKKTNTTKSPDVQPPIVNENPIPEIPYRILQLLNTPYTPTQDVYTNLDQYSKQSIKVGFNGDVDSAVILAKGKFLKDGLHFFSFTFGNISGVLNAIRSSPNTLDISASRLAGGVYEKSGEFTLNIDLKANTLLSTTKDEFINRAQGSKSIILWDSLYPSPPTVTRLLIAPFDKNGEYGGGSLDSIELQFTCVQGKECSAVVCLEGDLFTKCLKDNFGFSAAKSWCDRTNAPNCEKLKP
ncbi:MAG: hypothetical protein V1685_03120 [Parcubacteria group bacterium]